VTLPVRGRLKPERLSKTALKTLPPKEKLREIALLTLANVASDAVAAPAARAAAARTLLESLGDIGRLQALGGGAKPLSDMTAAEIDAEIEALAPAARMSKLKRPPKKG